MAAPIYFYCQTDPRAADRGLSRPGTDQAHQEAWDSVRDSVMLEALRAKFTQCGPGCDGSRHVARVLRPNQHERGWLPVSYP